MTARAGWLTGLAVAAMVPLAACPLAARADVPAGLRAPGDVSPLPVLGPAPDFHLRSLEGPDIRLGDLRGKLLLLSFVCPSCADEREDVAAGFVRLQGLLKARRLFGRKAVLVFVMRHPERETRTGLRAYALRLRVDPYGWLILGGPPEATQRHRDQFGRVGASPADPPADTAGCVFLVDYAGRVRRVYPAGAFQPEAALADLEGLL